jgi:hypothetical protein
MKRGTRNAFSAGVPRCSSILLLCLLHISASAADLPIAAGDAAATWRACELDLGLLHAGEAARRLNLALPSGDPQRVRQALAHALDCWHAPVPGGGHLLTRSPVLPAGELRSRVHPSTLADVITLEPQVRTALAPWLGAHAGIAANPLDGSWVATLDGAGHAALVALLTSLERPGAIPPLITPAPPDRAGPALPSAPWREQVLALATTWGVDVSVEADTAEPAPAIPAGAVADLPAAFVSAGVPAAWCAGVLCLGGQPLLRLHPGARVVSVLLPVPHLGDPALLALAIRSAWPIAWRDQPGWCVLPRDHALLVQADAAGIHAALGVLAGRDTATEGFTDTSFVR